MKNSYEEREALLNSVREIPAIHPRYGGIYKSMYSGKTEIKSSLGIRIIISLMLFVIFAAIEQGKISQIPVSTAEITYQIEAPMDVDMFQLMKR